MLYVYKGNQVHFWDTEANQGEGGGGGGGVLWWQVSEVPRQHSGCDISLS